MKRILLFAVMLAWAGASEGATYYISATGNDALNGLSTDNAWKTIAYVNDNTFSGDDSISFKKGDRWAGNFTFNDNGTSGHQITISSYGTGSAPEISGTHTISGNYVTVQNVTLRGKVTWSGTNGASSGVKGSGDTVVQLWAGETEESVLDNAVNTWAGGTRIYAETMVYDNVISMWDYFINNTFSGWTVTKTDIGNDNSSTYTIYAYIFTPTSYDRTIVINTGTHGFELDGTLASFKFFYHALNYSGSGALSITSRTRYVVCPFLNPWGLNNGRDGGNVDNVNINRNFSWGWDASLDANKGESAESEAETIILKGLIDGYGAVAFLDLHNQTADYNTFYGYGPYTDFTANSDPIIRTVEYLSGHGHLDTIFYNLSEPTANNYAASVGITASFTPEYGPRIDEANLPVYGSAYMTELVKYYGNIILSFSQTEPR